MQNQSFHYLIRIQYLGFRYSGWQTQPDQKTIEQMLLKTLRFVFPDLNYKILGAGRTDSKVSALDAAFELFLENKPIDDCDKFLKCFNQNLPSDIRALEINEIDDNFNILQNSKFKEYIYLFSFGTKNHPYCAPFMANIYEELNIDLMKKAAKLFEGEHDFAAFTAQMQEGAKSVRTIELCEIRKNALLQANFFPDTSYALHVKGKGFMRYQIRMIMGALIQVGKGILSVENIESYLEHSNTKKLNYIAPGSGLHLFQVEFN